MAPGLARVEREQLDGLARERVQVVGRVRDLVDTRRLRVGSASGSGSVSTLSAERRGAHCSFKRAKLVASLCCTTEERMMGTSLDGTWSSLLFSSMAATRVATKSDGSGGSARGGPALAVAAAAAAMAVEGGSGKVVGVKTTVARAATALDDALLGGAAIGGTACGSPPIIAGVRPPEVEVPQAVEMRVGVDPIES